MSSVNQILVQKDKDCKSIWFMRQAGRYLPEFRKIRSQNKNFINLCLNSSLSTEITLQPIKRFNLDAAIIFSDILLVPYALGQEVNFTKDLGPVLNRFSVKKFSKFNKAQFIKKLSPVYEAIENTRKKLNKNKSLISFIGAPWTLLVYMMGLKNLRNRIDDIKFKNEKSNIEDVLQKLIEFLCLHIKKQSEAGAGVVQVFDSWAGLVMNEDFDSLCIKPNQEIVKYCKKIKIPVICFPKGIKKKYKEFNEAVMPNGLNLDYEIDPLWAKKNLKNVVLQGGMDPKILLKDQEEIIAEAKKYLDIFKDVPYIFNLGHGIIPETNPEKLKK